MPLFVSTVTFMVVFFPVIFLSGLAKYLFTPLAVAVLFAVVASFLIAIFFVPVAAAKLMRKSAEKQSDIVESADQAKGWLVNGYRVLLLGSLKARWLVLAVATGLFVLSLGMASNTGRELFPPVDSGQFTIYVRAPSGTKLELSRDIVKKIENVIVEETRRPGS